MPAMRGMDTSQGQLNECVSFRASKRVERRVERRKVLSRQYLLHSSCMALEVKGCLMDEWLGQLNECVSYLRVERKIE